MLVAMLSHRRSQPEDEPTAGLCFSKPCSSHCVHRNFQTSSGGHWQYTNVTGAGKFRPVGEQVSVRNPAICRDADWQRKHWDGRMPGQHVTGPRVLLRIHTLTDQISLLPPRLWQSMNGECIQSRDMLVWMRLLSLVVTVDLSLSGSTSQPPSIHCPLPG